VALQILGTGPKPEDTASRMRRAIEEALPGSQVEVRAGSGGHFELRVVSAAFSGRSRVQQQQLVYKAITPLLTGPNAPVHAIDKMECITP
jgi:acid stress-induced BolA-like protein IbaG/YrbA